MAKTALCFFLLFAFVWLSEYFVHLQELGGIANHDAEIRLRNDLLKNYTVGVLPPRTLSSPVSIKFALVVIAIKNLDAKTQTLTSEAWLKFNWKDSRLTWNSDEYAGIQVIRLPPHKIWQPDIKLYNSAKMNEMEVNMDVFALLYNSGDVIFIPPVSLNTLCEVNLKYYPYDRHVCLYKFGSWTYDGTLIDIEPYDKVKLSMDLSDSWNKAGEWEITDTSVVKSNKKYACCEENYPDVTYYVTLQRRSPFYKAAILCPLISAAFFILAAFWISSTSCHRIMLNVVSFLTMTALLIHLSSKLPAVGNDCPLIMVICGILVVTSAFSTIISIVFMAMAKSKTEDPPGWIIRITKSPIMKLFCIETPKPDNVAGNDEVYLTNQVAEDVPKPSSRAVSKPNLWIMFFNLIDRFLFVFCLITFISVLSAIYV